MIFRITHVLSYNGSVYLFYCTLGKFKLKKFTETEKYIASITSLWAMTEDNQFMEISKAIGNKLKSSTEKH